MTYKEEKMKELDNLIEKLGEKEFYLEPSIEVRFILSQTIDSLEAKHKEEIEGIRADERKRVLEEIEKYKDTRDNCDVLEALEDTKEILK